VAKRLPLTGLAPAFALTDEAIDVDELVGQVVSSAAGAVATFIGVVRDNNEGLAVRYLEYEAHQSMALRSMEALVVDARARFEVGGVMVRHRLGRLEIGEISVVIAVAAPHRAAAMDACRWLIDTLKAEVPIFKKEHYEDGEAWVE
jgi:molybdopterin synthase catalytic subunit